ncbi:hypothetical protein QBC47DRAFT_444316, partial [Echria macrotheca]
YSTRLGLSSLLSFLASGWNAVSASSWSHVGCKSMNAVDEANRRHPMFVAHFACLPGTTPSAYILDPCPTDTLDSTPRSDQHAAHQSSVCSITTALLVWYSCMDIALRRFLFGFTDGHVDVIPGPYQHVYGVFDRHQFDYGVAER